MRKEERELLKMAQSITPNCSIITTSGNHFKVVFVGPLGKASVICSNTTSDVRAMKNMKRDMMNIARKVGLLNDNRNPVVSQSHC